VHAPAAALAVEQLGEGVAVARPPGVERGRLATTQILDALKERLVDDGGVL
jgi:hypothetical protein